MTKDPSHTALNGVLIGFGSVAVNAHLPSLNNHQFRIRAVIDPRSERIALAKRLIPGVRVFPDIAYLTLEKDIDFVDICTPPCHHADLVLSFCKAGLHVICEKPLVTRIEDLGPIEEAARRHQRVVFTVNNWKYGPLWSKVLDIVKAGSIGRIKFISLQVLRTPTSGGGISDWRRQPKIAGGGILLDHGWHNIYLVLSLMDEVPHAVQAKMNFTKTNGSHLEDMVDLVLMFRYAKARVRLSWNAPYRRNCGLIEGDKGTIWINDDHLSVASDLRSEPRRIVFPEALSRSSHHPEWMQPVLENFRREIFDPTIRGRNITEAKWCARIIDLAYRSYQEGSRPIPV